MPGKGITESVQWMKKEADELHVQMQIILPMLSLLMRGLNQEQLGCHSRQTVCFTSTLSFRETGCYPIQLSPLCYTTGDGSSLWRRDFDGFFFRHTSTLTIDKILPLRDVDGSLGDIQVHLHLPLIRYYHFQGLLMVFWLIYQSICTYH